MGGICPCGSVIMNVIDIAKAAFDALPNVNRVWVDANGHFHHSQPLIHQGKDAFVGVSKFLKNIQAQQGFAIIGAKAA